MGIINEQYFNWELRGAIAPGGAVLKVIGDDALERLWLASPAGLFCREGGMWRAVRRGVAAFWRVNTVAGNGRHLWLAGMPGGILRSANGGETWHSCWIEQTNEPIVAIAPSPDFGQDRVLLAATDGDGILRSTDGGRHWELANFGLQEFVVVDVMMAGRIGRYEYAFAITENGFYQSPNGGRAWRLVEVAQEIRPIALAISPNFAEDRVVCIGTEAGELFVSMDAGLSWKCASNRFDGVNGLAFGTAAALFVGTESAIYRVEKWEDTLLSLLSPLPSSLLSLTAIAGNLYAGLVDGLWVSADNGRSWQPDTTLAARRLVWYVAGWLAGGPEEGVWQTADGGQTWQAIWEKLPVLGLAVNGKEIWLSTVEGLVTSSDMGQSWQMAWETEEPLTALAAVDGVVWAGNSRGDVWRGERGVERGWEAVAVPFRGQHLVGFVVVEAVLLAVSWSAANNMLQLWRQTENDWQLWFSQSAGAVLPQVAVSEGRAIVGLGSFVYRLTETGWQRQRVASMETPITAVCALPGGGWLAAVTDALLYSADGLTWQPINELRGEPVVSLSVVEGKLVAGTAVGKIWVSQVL